MKQQLAILLIALVLSLVVTLTKAGAPDKTDVIGKINDRTLHRFIDVEKNIVCYTIEGGYDIHAISCVPLK